MPADIRLVDPRKLRLPGSRSTGADPYRLQLQMARFGASAVGMPPPWVYDCGDGTFLLSNGVTRATRIAKLAPGTLIRVEVIGHTKRTRPDPTVGDFA